MHLPHAQYVAVAASHSITSPVNMSRQYILQEMNEQGERTRFLQIWMTPNRHGHKPQYGSSIYSKSDRQNKLLHILGGTGTMPAWKTATPGAGISLHQASLSTSARLQSRICHWQLLQSCSSPETFVCQAVWYCLHPAQSHPAMLLHGCL